MTTSAAAVVNAVRERVRRLISVPASDAEALKICFLCSTVESDALLGDDALNQTRKFSLAAALAEDENDAERLRQRAAIEAALRLTLAEKQQRDLWESSPRTRTRVTLATLRKEGHVSCMQHALGEVLGSDLRRIEDLRYDTEESGIDIMSVAALITTVCTQIAA